MHDALSDIRQHTWDFWLTVATVFLLGSLGVQSFLGTAYAWWAQRTIAGWEQAGYNTFVTTMNAIAAPQVIALVVVMGLCVPKRLFLRRTLLAVSALMLVAGAGGSAATGSLALGLGVYLVLAALIQVAVVVLTVAGTRAPSYLTEGRLTKVGSGLLHFGFILMCVVVINLQRSRFMLPAFWLAATAILLGTALSFWAGRFAYRRHTAAGAEHESDAVTRGEESATKAGPGDRADAAAEAAGATRDEKSPLEVPDHGGDEGGGEFDELA